MADSNVSIMAILPTQTDGFVLSGVGAGAIEMAGAEMAIVALKSSSCI